MARPRKQIDKHQFESLCGLQCTLDEICGFFECDKSTVERWCKREYKMNFADIYNIKRQNGKISLRRSQMKLAEKNASMAIFLGKNMLGQTDQVIVSDATEDDGFLDALAGTAEEDWNGDI